MHTEQQNFFEGEEFRLTSGRLVVLQQIHIQVSAIGVLEGDVAWVRDRIVRDAPLDVKRVFGRDVGFVLFEPPLGQLPTYRLAIELTSLDPVVEKDANADCSALIVAWFASDLPVDLRASIASTIDLVVWEEHATNGYY